MTEMLTDFQLPQRFPTNSSPPKPISVNFVTAGNVCICVWEGSNPQIDDGLDHGKKGNGKTTERGFGGMLKGAASRADYEYFNLTGGKHVYKQLMKITTQF